mgnify:CR=1 FL=1
MDETLMTYLRNIISLEQVVYVETVSYTHLTLPTTSRV